jgi:hypothetical protein
LLLQGKSAKYLGDKGMWRGDEVSQIFSVQRKKKRLKNKFKILLYLEIISS